MGNSTLQCPCCQQEFKPVASRSSEKRNTCTYCTEFFQSLNSRVSKLQVYRGNDFSPLHMVDYSKAFLGPVTKTTPIKLCILGRSQTAPPTTPDLHGLGSFWHKTPIGDSGALRYDCAISRQAPVANLMKTQVCLAVPPGIFMLEGKAAAWDSPSEWYPGGGAQVFLPLSVVKALYIASEKLWTREMSPASYKTFLEDCKPAFAAQTAWWNDFAQAEAKVLEIARQANLLRVAREAFTAALECKQSDEHVFQLLVKATTAAEAAHKAATALSSKVDAERLLQSIKTKRIEIWCQIEEKCPDEYTTEEWVATRCFEDYKTGNLLHTCPSDVRSLLLSDGASTTGARLGSSIEGKPFAIHREGKWTLMIILTFDHQETKTSGKTTITTYYYLLTRKWV